MDENELYKELIKQGARIAKVPILNLLNPPAKAIGGGLSSIFNLIFFPFNLLYTKAEPFINKFKTKCADELNAIPKERLVEPKLNKIGPILEASKYYVEDEVLREMFAKLLASSCDSRFSEASHVSFVQILKQITPQEAKWLKELYLHRYEGIVEIRYNKDGFTKENKSSVSIGHLIPIDSLVPENYDLFLVALENLQRLSIIKIINNSKYTVTGKYDSCFSHKCTLEIIKELGKDNTRIDEAVWHFTTFGEMFVETCTDLSGKNPKNAIIIDD